MLFYDERNVKNPKDLTVIVHQMLSINDLVNYCKLSTYLSAMIVLKGKEMKSLPVVLKLETRLLVNEYI